MESNRAATEEYSPSNDEAQQILKNQQSESSDVASRLCSSHDSILPSASNSQVNMCVVFFSSNQD